MPSGTQTSYKGSYSFLVIISAFIVILSVGAMAFYNLYTQRFNQEEKIAQLFTRQNSSSLEMWIKDQVSIAQVIASTPRVQNLCENPKNLFLREKAKESLELFQSTHQEYTLITIIPFFDPNESILIEDDLGNYKLVKNAQSIVDSADSISVGVGGLDFNYIKAIYDGSEIYISEAKPNAIAGLSPIFMVSVPIYVGNKLMGALAFGVKLEHFSNLFNTSINLSKSGQIGIIDDRGLYVSHSNPKIILNKESDEESQEILKNLQAGENSFNIRANNRNWKYTTSLVDTDLQSTNKWWFLYKRDHSELYSELLVPVVILLVLCIFLFLFIVFVTLRVNKAIAHFLKEQNLRKEVELHHVYTQNINFGIALLNSKNIFIDINPAAIDLLKATKDSIIGKNLDTLFTTQSESLAQIITIIEKRENKKLLNVTLNLKNNYEELFDISFSPIDILGVNSYSMLTITPVPNTRDFEERMMAIYTASPDIYLTFDDKFNLLECTDTAVELFKAKSKEDVIKNFTHFSPPLQPNGANSIIYALDLINLAIKQKVQRFEWLHIDSKGEKVPCEITLIGFSLKGKPASIAGLRDMRKQRKYEVALIKERAILRSIIDNIQGIVFLRDKDLRYLIINKHYSTTFGFTQEQVYNKVESDILPANFITMSAETDNETIITDGPFTFEQTLTLLDNTQRDYLFTKESLYTPSGDFDGILTVGIDITRLKEAERQISIAKMRAEEADQAKSDFLARMSHEIRTPMNAIIGICYLCMQTQLDSQQTAYLDKINNAADHLMSILNSILDFSKIESGKVISEEIAFDLDLILSKLETLLEEQAQTNNLKLNIFCADNVPRRLIGDPVHLLQILLNLGANAIKFTPVGSVTIELHLENTLEDRVYLRGYISDTGIGMSPEQIEKLFEPFTQSTESISRLYGGTGLGLVISKSLIELMDGKIWVESTINQGSNFHFNIWLKVDNPEDMEYNIDTNNLLQQFNNKEITFHAENAVLVAEDNLINQEIIMELLERVGIRVDLADNGEQAIELCTQKNYDLIFMDIQMPIMDGITACTHIRATNKTVPIIAMTANAQLSDRQKSLEAGMNEHITKPIELEKLYACLKHYIPYTND